MKVLLFCLLLLSGCAQTQLHIISQGYSETKIAQLKKSLDEQGLDIVISKIAVPADFANVALTMNPGFSDLSIISTIEQALESQGFDKATQYRFAEGRHFYSTEHLGLYLRNVNTTQLAMPPYLRTQYCKNADATIMFKDSREFVLEYDGKHYDDALQTIQGDFDFDGKYLLLKPNDLPAQKYSLYKEERPTPFGDKPADVFKPHNKHHQQKQLNCDFLIIYMD